MENEKVTFFDRQIKLLGVDGQKKLEESHVCFVEISCVTIEIIKECLLYGIGKITMISDSIVEMDSLLTENYYIKKDDVGKYIVDVLKSNMDCINNFTKIFTINKKADDVFIKYPSIFHQFRVVVFSQMLISKKYMKLIEYLYENNIFSMFVDLICEMGIFEPQYNSLYVLQPCPDYKTSDLRLLEPFDELKSFYQNYKVELCLADLKKILSISYPILVMDCIDIYKKDFGEITQLDNLLRKKLLQILECKYSLIKHAENFKQAYHHIKCGLGYFPAYKIPENISKLLKIYKNYSTNFNIDKDNFWKIVQAISNFINEKGRLPYTTLNLEDIVCTTQHYLELKKLYSNKFWSDVNTIQNYILKQNHSKDNQLLIDIIHFCENLFHVTHIHTLSIFDQRNEFRHNVNLNKDDPKLMKIFSLINYNDSFVDEHHAQYSDDFKSHKQFYVASSIHLAGITSCEIMKLCSNKHIPIKSIIFLNVIYIFYDTSFLISLSFTIVTCYGINIM